VLGYLKEYMSQAWHDKLVATYGLDARAFGKCSILYQLQPGCLHRIYVAGCGAKAFLLNIRLLQPILVCIACSCDRVQ
jgi:hypothetical protein